MTMNSRKPNNWPKDHDNALATLQLDQSNDNKPSESAYGIKRSAEESPKENPEMKKYRKQDNEDKLCHFKNIDTLLATLQLNQGNDNRPSESNHGMKRTTEEYPEENPETKKCRKQDNKDKLYHPKNIDKLVATLQLNQGNDNRPSEIAHGMKRTTEEYPEENPETKKCKKQDNEDKLYPKNIYKLKSKGTEVNLLIYCNALKKSMENQIEEKMKKEMHQFQRLGEDESLRSENERLIENLRAEMREHNENLRAESERQKENFKAEMIELTEYNDNLRAENDRLKQNLRAELREDIENLRAENERLKENLRAEMRELREDNDNSRAENERLKENLGAEMKELREDYQSLRDVMRKLREEDENLRAEMKELREDNENLRAENERLKEGLTTLEDRGHCTVCLTEQSNCLLRPCHHWVMCYQCYLLLPKRHLTGKRQCPVCRLDIDEVAQFLGI